MEHFIALLDVGVAVEEVVFNDLELLASGIFPVEFSKLLVFLGVFVSSILE